MTPDLECMLGGIVAKFRLSFIRIKKNYKNFNDVGPAGRGNRTDSCPNLPLIRQIRYALTASSLTHNHLFAMLRLMVS